MISVAPRFVFLLVMAMLAVLVFPAATGSFTATHGPATALRAARFLRSLLAAIISWSSLLLAIAPLLSRARHTAAGSDVAALTAQSLTLAPMRC